MHVVDLSHVLFRALAALALVAALVLTLAGGAAAKTRFAVAARGLDNPRGLAFLPNGHLVVAEAGHAGNVCLGPGACLGLNGKVTEINNGHRVELATALPSFGGPFGAFGLGGVAVQTGELFAQVGLNPQAFGKPSADCKGQPHKRSCTKVVTAAKRGAGVLGQVKSLHSNQGVTPFAHVGRVDFDYAAAHPDPGNPEYAPGDANPFGLTPGPRGGFYVVDAASNTLDHVTSSGHIRVLAFVPDPPQHKPIYDAAPTCAARTPAGKVFIATESNSLWRWNGKSLTKVLTGGKLGQVVGCVADTHGNLYLANLTAKIRGSFPNFNEKPFDGSIVKVTPNLTTSYVATGLNFPTGLTFGPDGRLYVDINGLCPKNLSLLNHQNAPKGACPQAGKVVSMMP